MTRLRLDPLRRRQLEQFDFAKRTQFQAVNEPPCSESMRRAGL
jgi:hypothetical protein